MTRPLMSPAQLNYRGRVVYSSNGWVWVLVTHRADGQPVIMRQLDGDWLTPFRPSELT